MSVAATLKWSARLLGPRLSPCSFSWRITTKWWRLSSIKSKSQNTREQWARVQRHPLLLYFYSYFTYLFIYSFTSPNLLFPPFNLPEICIFISLFSWWRDHFVICLSIASPFSSFIYRMSFRRSMSTSPTPHFLSRSILRLR